MKRVWPLWISIATLSLPALAGAPRSTIWAVIEEAEANRLGRVVGVDFVQGRWDVYHVQRGRIVETVLEDGTLRRLRAENQRRAALSSKLTVRQAIQRALTRVRGTVISAELEREGGVRSWSVVVLQQRGSQEIAVHADTGRILDVESTP